MKTNEDFAAAPSSRPDMLRDVREKIEKGWTRRADAKDADGISVAPWNPNAVCWCLSGATLAVSSRLGALRDVATALSFSSVEEMIDWNDERRRTKAEVLERIDQALERAGGGE